MAKYSADIEIAVRGGQQLNNTIKALNRLNNSINVVTRNAKLLEGRGFNVASIENYSRAVSKAERAVRKAAEGTNQERQAITALVSAMELENRARERKNILIAREIANQRRVVATANAGVGMQGPALPGYMMRGPSSPIGGGLRSRGGRGSGGGGGSRLGGAISGSIIGGAFPLLFGQGAGAAAGGAIGGLVGGLAGPGGSFAGSLLGTLLGDIASKGNTVKKLAEDIGFSADQTKLLETAFKQAGAEFDKFESSVQNIRGLGLDIESQAKAIRLVSTLTAEYGGEIDKVTNALTSSLESGKVTQATLNQLTSQGIPIQQALADKYKVSRSELLQMAKDGKIAVQDLIDELVVVGNKGVEAADKPKSSFDRLKDSVDNLGKSIASLGNSLVASLGPAFSWLTDRVTDFVNAISRAISRLADLMAGGRMTQATIQAETAAQQATNKKFGPLGGIRAFNPAAETFYQQQKQTNLKKLVPGAFPSAKPPTPLQSFAAPAQLPPSDGGGESAADKAAKAAAKEAARVAELVRDRQLATLELQRQAVFSQKIAEAEMAKDPILVRQLQGQQEIMQLGIKTASELEKEKNSMAQLAIARKFQAKKALALLGIELDIAKIKQQQTEQYNTIISDLDTELALKYAITEQERTQLRIAAEMRKLRLSDPYLTEPQLMQIQQGKERLAAPKTGAELIAERSGALQDELKALTDSGNQAITIATGIGDAFSNSFKGIIEGSMTAREALAGFFQSVADQFLDMAAQIIAKMITMAILNQILGVLPGAGGAGGGAAALGSNPNVAAYSGTGIGDIGIGTFGGARAKGGPVSGGQMYMVGERGPELFVPGRSGTIVPNDKMGGGSTNVVVNVDAKGSSVEGNEQGANQLGRVISAAVQSELIKQQRPGGLLAR